MDDFTIEIAKMVFRVQPMFESTREYCRPYLSDRAADFSMKICDDDLEFEQMMLNQEAREEGLKLRKFTAPFLERTSIQRRVADQLLYRDTLMVHGSAVSVDGNAYLFLGPCGTGKSTHTRLWREVFGNRAVMINDDKPFLQITSTGVLAYGSPWSGKHGLATNMRAPLKGICLLHRGKVNHIVPLGIERGLSLLRHQAHAPADPAMTDKVDSLLEALCRLVPLWEMDCNMDQDAARVSYGAMASR